MKELYPWAKPGEIYIRMQESFSDKTGQDYNNFQNKYTEKYGGPLTQYAAGDKQHPKITAEEYRQKYEPGKGSEVQGFSSSEPSYQMVQFFKNNPNGVYQGPIFEGFAPEGAPNEPSELTNPLNVILKNKLEGKVNTQFKEIKTATTFNYGRIDAPTLEASKNLTAAIQNFFVNKPITADFTLTDITKEGATTISGHELAGFTVADVGWNMTNNIYELKLVGGTKDAPINKTVHLDGQYIRNSTLDKMLNTPENRVAGIVAQLDMHKRGEVSTREVKKILSEAIDAEEKRNPLTDEKLMDLLKDKGYNIARRTVAKYREQLNIPVARMRKELK